MKKRALWFLTIFVAMIAFTAWAEEMVELVVWDQLPQAEKVILSFNEKMEKKEGRDVRG